MVPRSLVCAVLAVLFAPLPSVADLVTFSFTGSITDIRLGGQTGTPISSLDGIDVGDMFSGSFAYETNDASGGPTLYFFNPTSTNTVAADIDGLVFDTPIGSISGAQTFDNPPGNADVFSVFKGAPSLPAGWSVPSGGSTLRVAFVDNSGTTLPNSDLPISFDPNDWDQGVLLLTFANDVVTPSGTFNNVYIEGNINLMAMSVPEPAGLLMCGCALIAAGLGRHRSRSWSSKNSSSPLESTARYP